MQTIIGENNHIIELDNREACRETVSCLIAQAKKYIAILSQDLEYTLYHQTAINHAMKKLITHNRQSHIRILCNDSRKARQHSHHFVNLAQNYSSFIEIRKPTSKKIIALKQSWLIIDDVAYCKITNSERYQGKACFNDRLTVKETLEEFNQAWENSSVDQETLRLSL